jgi:hypothetical protein
VAREAAVIEAAALGAVAPAIEVDQQPAVAEGEAVQLAHQVAAARAGALVQARIERGLACVPGR